MADRTYDELMRDLRAKEKQERMTVPQKVKAAVKKKVDALLEKALHVPNEKPLTAQQRAARSEKPVSPGRAKTEAGQVARAITRKQKDRMTNAAESNDD